ncbi:RnfH family protein [Thiosulfativibrio zosterae]|uniref:UPF0125 protein THMIRHAT_16200 n=1 Tax=Thiosulfativibrio zosterae TaxID=2675053 RepID=A0A6F8PPA0_9GAMM|nr:RnfH family protein [Thiosulfativibrio zosterae]BBP43874.1 UPF0125 protein [Thiosulfativibrio zosterae]
MEADSKMIFVEIAYGLVDKQYLYGFEVPEGSTIEQAVLLSPLIKEIPDLNYEQVGIFAKLMPASTVLKAGDRIEVYRPLKIDPRKRRRDSVEKERKESIK